jgi:putative acetyltransferase
MYFQIREIKSTDNTALANVIRNCFEELGAPKTGSVYDDPTTDCLFETFNMTPKSIYWVVEVEKTIMGGAGIFPTPDLPDGVCELVKIYLSPALRGKGVGKILLETCFKSARELGYSQVYLESFPEFGKAVSLYERVGFKPIPDALGNSGHTSCTIWMVRDV